MKLYGTIKSERAEKGQGGNDYLLIEISNSNKAIVAKIKATSDDNGMISLALEHNEELCIFENTKLKKCECIDPLCAKCLLKNCQDDDCKIHPLNKKLEFREMYKNR